MRAGWQCRKCRSCQVCRMTGDETKLMSCEQCDKVYHASCQRPIVTSIPKYGWKCRVSKESVVIVNSLCMLPGNLVLCTIAT